MPKLFWELRISLPGAPNPVVVSRSERACDSITEGTVGVPGASTSPARRGKKILPGTATLPLPRATGGEDFLLLYLSDYTGGVLKYGTGKTKTVLTQPLVLEGRRVSSFLGKGASLLLENHAEVERNLRFIVGRREPSAKKRKASRDTSGRSRVRKRAKKTTRKRKTTKK